MRSQGHNANSPQKAAQNRGLRDTPRATAALHCMEAWSACCALIEAQPVWRHPWGAKTGVPGQKRRLPTPKKEGFGQTKEKMQLQENLICSSKGHGYSFDWADQDLAPSTFGSFLLNILHSPANNLPSLPSSTKC